MSSELEKKGVLLLLKQNVPSFFIDFVYEINVIILCQMA
jgi:hypothetical protein